MRLFISNRIITCPTVNVRSVLNMRISFVNMSYFSKVSTVV